MARYKGPKLSIWVAKGEPEPKRQRLDKYRSEDTSNRTKLIAERSAEVVRRLLDLGWNKRDMIFHVSREYQWNWLVEQPEPLTERIWAEIKPKLIPILESNRAIILTEMEAQRASARKSKLRQILADMKRADPPLIAAHISRLAPRSSPGSASPNVWVSHKRWFPPTVDRMAFPIIKTLRDTDATVAQMEARFEEHREEIDAHILEWRIKAEGHLAELLRQGRISDGLKKAVSAPKLPVGKSGPNPFKGLSDDFKLLLRADSLFESRYDLPNPRPTYYVDTLLEDWDYEERPLDLSKYKRHAKAQEVARALLAGMKKTNASFLELQSVGSRFKCGRCRTGSTQNWLDIIRHYMDEQRDWEERFGDYVPKAQKLGITLQNVHAFDTNNKKPLIKIFNSGQYGSRPNPSAPSNFKCLLCIQIGLDVDGETEEKVVAHITKLHGVAEPEWEEHYNIFQPEIPEDDSVEESDDGYSSYDRRRGYARGAYGSDDEENNY